MYFLTFLSPNLVLYFILFAFDVNLTTIELVLFFMSLNLESCDDSLLMCKVVLSDTKIPRNYKPGDF